MEQDGRFFILFFNIVILISRIDFLKAIFSSKERISFGNYKC